jgi:hypothetical protein
MFRDWFEKKPQPLSGTPPVRRVKTYSAESGYAWQYYYEGQRPVRTPQPGFEFVFTVSADRKTWSPVPVILPDSAVLEWQRTHTRELNSSERYAMAKLGLFAAFDQRATPAAMQAPVLLTAADLATFAARLEFE